MGSSCYFTDCIMHCLNKTGTSFQMAVNLNAYEDNVKVLQKNSDYPIRVGVEGNSCLKQVNKEQKHEPTNDF